MRKQTFSRIKKTIGILLAVLLTVTFTVASASSYPISGDNNNGYPGNGYDGYNNGYWHDYWYPGHVNIGHDNGGYNLVPGHDDYKMAGILAERPGNGEFVTHYPGDENRYGEFFSKLEARGYA